MQTQIHLMRIKDVSDMDVVVWTTKNYKQYSESSESSELV